MGNTKKNISKKNETPRYLLQNFPNSYSLHCLFITISLSIVAISISLPFSIPKENNLIINTSIVSTLTAVAKEIELQYNIQKISL